MFFFSVGFKDNQLPLKSPLIASKAIDPYKDVEKIVSKGNYTALIAGNQKDKVKETFENLVK